MRILLLMLLFLLPVQTSWAQNLLNNGDLESQPLSIGDHLSQSAGWQNVGLNPSTNYWMPKLLNIVGVDGPGGSQFGQPPMDADGDSGLKHYGDMWLHSGANRGYAWQQFTAPCTGPATASIHFSSRSLSGVRAWFAVSQHTGPVVDMPAQPAASVAISDLVNNQPYLDVLVPARNSLDDFAWKQFQTPVLLQAGQKYTFMIKILEDGNFDNASITYDNLSFSNGRCFAKSVSSNTSSQATNVSNLSSSNPAGNGNNAVLDYSKSCQPPIGLGNGEFEWRCQLSVSGSNLDPNHKVVLSDMMFGQTGSTFQGYIGFPFIQSTGSSYSSNENWQCGWLSNLAPGCVLPASDLIAAGGVSTIDSTVRFNPSTQVQGTNTGSGAPSSTGFGGAAIAPPAQIGNCIKVTSGPWSSQLSSGNQMFAPHVTPAANSFGGLTAPVQSSQTCAISDLPASSGTSGNTGGSSSNSAGSFDYTKTCDPLVDLGNGSYVLTCTLTVNSAGINPNMTVVLADAFGGQTGSTGTVLPFQTSFTSSDPWNCGTLQPNIEGCTLPASALIAAGGTSTIQSTTVFQNPENMDQAFNCLVGNLSKDPIVPGTKSATSTGLPQLKTGKSAASPHTQFGDACVVVDLGKTEPKPTVEKFHKQCQSMPRMGASQIVFCQFDVVTSGPVTGTLTVNDLFTQLSGPNVAYSSQLGSSDPGWQCNTTSCSISGTDFATLGNVSSVYAQFVFPAGGYDDARFENCGALLLDGQPFGNSNCVPLGNGDANSGGNPGGGSGVSDPITADAGSVILQDPVIPGTPDDPTGPDISVGPGISLDAEIQTPIIIPQDPELEVVKECDPTIPQGNWIWKVPCRITVSGRHLPAGQQIKVLDHMDKRGPMQTVGVRFPNHSDTPFILNNWGGRYGHGSYTHVSTSALSPAPHGAQTGSITLNVEGTYSGIPDPSMGLLENCARATLEQPSGGVQAANPQDPNRSDYCVPIVFPDVDNSTRPPATGDVASCSLDTLFVVDSSGSMAGQRMSTTKASINAAMQIFQGGGSKAGLVKFGNFASTVVSPMQPLPSSQMVAEVANLNAIGATNWQSGFTEASSYVSPLADKPLVLFITDGLPNRTQPALSNPTAQNIAQASFPNLNLLRSLGSRVIGVGIGLAIPEPTMAQVFGPSGIHAGPSTTVDPFTTDYIMIPDITNAVRAFTQIAHAYCPDRPKPSGDVLSAALAMEKSAVQSSYRGDDEFLTAQTEEAASSSTLPLMPAPAPSGSDGNGSGEPKPTLPSIVKPKLQVQKQAIDSCRVNRNTQSYSCKFRLVARNIGRDRYVGPLSITDQFGKPRASKFALSQRNGWSCSRINGNKTTCTNPRIDIAAGGRSRFDMVVTLPGVSKGRSTRNCAWLGVPNSKKSRIKMIQQIMNDHGLEAGPVDGIWGGATKRALSKLKSRLGIANTPAIDEQLFRSLGLLGNEKRACADVALPPMPLPILKCDRRSTVQKGDSKCRCRYDNMRKAGSTKCVCKKGWTLKNGVGCVKPPKPLPVPSLKCQKATTIATPDGCACRYPNMVRTSRLSCGCKKGYKLVAGRGCKKIIVKPKPVPPQLKCDPRSTRLRGNTCVCTIPGSVKISKTRCGCRNGTVMVKGRCLGKPRLQKPTEPTRKPIKLSPSIKITPGKALIELKK